MMSPTPGGSILITSAPRSPSNWPGERAGDERAELEDAHACEGCASGVSDVLVTGGTVGSRASQRGGHMDFASSARSDELKAELVEFDHDIVRPAEPIYRDEREESGDPHFPPPVMEELKTEARKRDLWNLFMPEGDHGAELSNLDYAPLCEVMGSSPLLVGGDELLGARHREHGDPRPVRHAAAAGAVAAAAARRRDPLAASR